MIFMFSYHGLWPGTPPRLLHAPLTAILALQFVRAASGVDGTRYFSPALGFSIHWWGGRLSALTHVTRCAASYVLAQGGLGFPLSLDYLSGLYCQISGLCPPLISASSYFLTIVTCLHQQMPKGSKDLTLFTVSLDPTAATTLTRPSGADLIVVKSTIILDYLESPSQSTGAVLQPRGDSSKSTNILQY